MEYKQYRDDVEIEIATTRLLFDRRLTAVTNEKVGHHDVEFCEFVLPSGLIDTNTCSTTYY